jgi:pSer/pThr/pTyr-binding forkhead associated (FHA) protein
MPAPKPQPRLRLIGLGELSPGEHRFELSRIAIGNGVDNDFVIAHPTVSRKHAMLRAEGGGYLLEDLASSNGTFVNGRRIKQPMRIKPGDEIGFGATRFAVTRGTGISATPRRRRPLARRSIAIAGIMLFAIAGFVGARYLIELQRSRSLTNRSTAKAAQAKGAVTAGGTTAPAGEASNAETAAEEPSTEPTASGLEETSPQWLTHLNEFRVAAGLAAVAEDPNFSAGDRDHAIYLVNNFATDIRAGGLGAQAHIEDVHMPWYTPQGAEAARSSDESEQVSSGKKNHDPQQWSIDGWMSTPFHRLFILSPLLHQVGFGFDCEDDICVALLNVLSGADPLPRAPMPLDRPTLFPPDGGAIPSSMRTLETEWPTPISGCDGYAFPVGIAITVELGPMVDAQLDSFTLSGEDGATLEACGFDANSYRNPNEEERTRVVGGLRSQGAVVIVPRNPLDAGARYDVLATVNGRDYKWSFSVAH